MSLLKHKLIILVLILIFILECSPKVIGGAADAHQKIKIKWDYKSRITKARKYELEQPKAGFWVIICVFLGPCATLLSLLGVYVKFCHKGEDEENEEKLERS